jgi:hypothetical protein
VTSSVTSACGGCVSWVQLANNASIAKTRASGKNIRRVRFNMCVSKLTFRLENRRCFAGAS